MYIHTWTGGRNLETRFWSTFFWMGMSASVRDGFTKAQHNQVLLLRGSQEGVQITDVRYFSLSQPVFLCTVYVTLIACFYLFSSFVHWVVQDSARFTWCTVSIGWKFCQDPAEAFLVNKELLAEEMRIQWWNSEFRALLLLSLDVATAAKDSVTTDVVSGTYLPKQIRYSSARKVA